LRELDVMKVFERVNGRWTITADTLRIEEVTTSAITGREYATTLLSNGRSVYVICENDTHLSFYTSKGRRSIRIAPHTVLNFYVDGELVAAVDHEWARKFDVIREPVE
jgi:hypothetical protein